MKDKDKINGLNKRHVSQIVRRLSITKVTPSGKTYNRKKNNNEQTMSENSNLLLARELKQAINQMVLDNDQILYNADLMYGINSKEAEGMRKSFSEDENDLMMIRQIMLTDKDGKYKHIIQSMIRNLDTAVRDYIPVSVLQHYTNFEIFNQ